MTPTRVGVVDLGTNSTRLLVADVEGGSVRELDRRLRITRLGESVDRDRRLVPAAIARVRRVLADYREAIEALGADRTLAIATSAVRDAANGLDFLGAIESELGFETRLLSGDEEALTMFRGVASGRTVADRTLVVDVGGGSTELVLGGPGGVEFHVSLDLGCVRLTERFLAHDPPAPPELEACSAFVRSLLERQVPAEVKPDTAIGVAGTVTTLATLDLGLDVEVPEHVHGHLMAAGWIAAEVDRLAEATVAERRARPGIHPDRAPVIVAGAIVIRETLLHFGLELLEASEHDIMHGAALAAAESAE
ncbi:MAG TPA: Ppx/GppA phosphatase family protein [Gaiellaceae bacterium]|nr:Ppx/GppA phosphatase family protein [Gaiellaceae bacterium]